MSKKSKQKNKAKVSESFNKSTLIRLIMEMFNRNPAKVFNYKQVAKRIGTDDSATKQLIVTVLDELALCEKLEMVAIGQYRMKTRGGFVTGILSMTNRGVAQVVTTEMVEPIMIAPSNLLHALNGDEVKVHLFARRKNTDFEGEVVEIVKQVEHKFVGVVEIGKSFAFLATDDKTMPYDIFIPLENLKGAKHGYKAIAQIVDWPQNMKNPLGKVVEVLGIQGANETEMHAILSQYHLPLGFPEALDKVAEKIDDKITDAEIATRIDFRPKTTFTIDPEDAKDFDDALSLHKLENGNWEVGVHIADVSHYIDEGSKLDKEALERGTSVYLVDRVVPMIPERLSNFICSLRPNEDKLTFSVIFEIDSNANVVNHSFSKTIIRSNRRFSYDEVLQIITDKAGEYCDELLVLNDLAKKIRAIRFQSGAIGFDRSEMRFKIDAQGKPLSVYNKVANDATQLIEEFMLLANRKVAEFVGKTARRRRKGSEDEEDGNSKTFVYRIHDEPDTEKLMTFNNFIARFGYAIKMRNKKEIADSLNNLLANLKSKEEGDIISSLAVRSMAKAVYSTKNIGHYGLAFDYYTHFTSPIRRYPDLMVHRLLFRYMKNGKSVTREKYEEMCKYASGREQMAAEAERASIKYKQVEFMYDKIGNVYEGIISGVTQWGLYVELVETKIEGMIPLRNIDDDFYVFLEKQFCIEGQRTGKRFTLGERIQIQVIRTNLQKRQLDFAMVDKHNSAQDVQDIKRQKPQENRKPKQQHKEKQRKK